MTTNKLFMGEKDYYVVFIAYQKKTDYIVTSDFLIIKRSKEYGRIKGIDFMAPLTTVAFLNLLYSEGKINLATLFEKVLCLFKYKEIDNMVSKLHSKNLNVPKPDQNAIIESCINDVKERFQVYKIQ